MDVIGELIVRPEPRRRRRSTASASVIIEEIRSYQDDPAEYAQILFQQAMFGDGPLGREICGDEAGIRALPDGHDPRLLADDVPAREHRRGRAGDLDHGEAVELAAAAFGTGNGVVPGFEPAPALPAGERVRARQAPRQRRPSSSSACRRCGATTPTAGPCACSTRVLGDGMSSRLFLSVREERGLAYDIGSGSSTTPTRARSRSRPGSIPTRLRRGARARSSSSWRACATSSCPTDELGQGEGATCRAASSCGWTRPATSRRGSAARRRCTTAC